MIFKEQYEAIKNIAEKIYYEPELGYKEEQTKETITDFLKKVNPNIEIENFSTTGFTTTLGEDDKPLHIAFIAELDAVYAPTHMYAHKDTGAAHNCGHYAQVGITLALYRYLFTTGAYKDFDFKITFVFVPAEEYLDLTYRDELIKQQKITHYGGKPEAMKLGVFDDIDLALCVHAMGGEFSKRTIEINCDLAGFMYKKYHFKGQATHAGFNPFDSKNAYNMSTLFNVAVGLSRQQIQDDEHVRINPIVMDSDMSTNVIPNQITVGTDMRAKTVGYMKEVATKLDAAANGSAQALQGEVAIDTQMGYLPFIQNRYLSAFVQEAYDENKEIEDMFNDQAISAAGDIGDLSFMIPSIQIGHSGFTGTIHGDDFIHVDSEFIFEVFPRFLSEVLEKMNGNIDHDELYKKSYEEYASVIGTIISSK